MLPKDIDQNIIQNDGAYFRFIKQRYQNAVRSHIRWLGYYTILQNQLESLQTTNSLNNTILQILIRALPQPKGPWNDAESMNLY